jgi:hypothetical protein
MKLLKFSTGNGKLKNRLDLQHPSRIRMSARWCVQDNG